MIGVLVQVARWNVISRKQTPMSKTRNRGCPRDERHAAERFCIMRVLVIGASKGIGLETTRQALAAGHRVRALAD